jgi:L-2-hydroxycarboxylate dehydrogenase (NAD+)
MEAAAAAHSEKAGGLLFSTAEIDAFNEIARECGRAEFVASSLPTYEM